MKVFLQWLRRRWRRIQIQTLPIFSALAMSFLTMALMFVALLIMSNAAALGKLFWVVLLGYLGGLAAIVAAIHHYREMRDFRALVGEEEFFRIYPRKRRREERRKQRKNHRKGTERT